MLLIQKIKIFNDNLVWIIQKNKKCVIIDPGLATPIIKKLEIKKIIPIYIFLTHMHFDHIHGIFKLLQNYPNIKIFTPQKIKNIQKKNQVIIKKKKNIFIFNQLCKIFPTPGHTHKDISYYIYPYLFCGDILFSGGCGNTSQGCSKNLYKSLNVIKNLPKKTIFFNSHEYTINNLLFAKKIYKKDLLIQEYLNFLKKNFKNKISYSFLEDEKKINFFLRIDEIGIKEMINYWYNSASKIEYFCNLRKIKDQY
ncbi:hydroxyacylglutathione hydrolase [Buchnera aphidicola]|uniref:hydroxyacylglutathione hydrolase n=1 Tax=Buchnera aphidicola TaxID=9 RepID=UPI00209316C7|nr:hydroxyacylglutathione hydrolase [Buchnera aphidicola]USS94293.1 hydroxyacylglutathione hydrolase [Buchnera aphidicola (Sipha maydis)]WII23843.1 hydroxyacylglutathione hydrolase [Buchnera aphidicola (Sipha maydis)]